MTLLIRGATWKVEALAFRSGHIGSIHKSDMQTAKGQVHGMAPTGSRCCSGAGQAIDTVVGGTRFKALFVCDYGVPVASDALQR